MARAAHAGQGKDAARKLKETELATLFVAHPALALAHGELVASLPFPDPSLDRLRHELLNLAASGSSLEKPPVFTHFIAQGMAELLTRLGVSQTPSHGLRSGPKPAGYRSPFRACRRRSARNGEWEPERARAFQRLGSEASEEKLAGSHGDSCARPASKSPKTRMAPYYRGQQERILVTKPLLSKKAPAKVQAV